MQEALERERQRLDQRVAQVAEEQRSLLLTTVEAQQKELERLEGRMPRVKLRFWHLRYQCKLCREGKTEDTGKWTCPKCYFVQFNIPEDL